MILSTEGLTKKFDTITAVSKLDFRLQQGSLKAVIGPNGAGKTTFFNLLTGSLIPTTGNIQFNGQDITNLASYDRVKRGIGRSFQVTNIFESLTVSENVHAAAQRQQLDRPWNFWSQRDQFTEVTERCDEVLQRVGLYDMKTSEASELPHGDKRRLEIAITLATNPELILLDEPTAGMSPEETEQSINLIENISNDYTILLIEHDMDVVADVADEIMVLHRGRKLVEGAPKDVLTDDRVQKAYLGGV